MCEVLPVEAARLCERFAKAGGKITVVGAMPRLALDPSDDGEVQSIMTELEQNSRIRQFEMDQTEELSRNLRENIPEPVRIVKGCAGTVNNHPCYPPYLIDPYMHGGEE